MGKKLVKKKPKENSGEEEPIKKTKAKSPDTPKKEIKKKPKTGVSKKMKAIPKKGKSNVKSKANASGKLKKEVEEEGKEGKQKEINLTPKTKGLSLGAKLGITITLVSAILTLVVGFSVAWQTRSFISEEIIKSGITSAQFLSTQAKEALKKHYTGQEDNVIRFKEKVQRSLNAEGLKKITEDNYSRNSTILDGYVTFSEVNNGRPEKIFSLNNTKTGNSKIEKIASGHIFPEDKNSKSDLLIYEAVLTKNNIEYAVYSFQLDIEFDVSSRFTGVNYRPEKGKVYLFLSAAKVAESEASVFKTTALILAISVCVSILIAYFLSKSITSPILQLVKDMTIVQRGDLEHVTEAHSSDEVGYLSNTFNGLTKTLRVAHEAEIVKEKLEHDMSIGREIQQNLLPQENKKIKGYDSDCYYLSAKEVGGDYYDLIDVDRKNHKLGVVVADVSGKGIQGAMVMTVMRTIMNIAASASKTSFDSLVKTNKFLTPKIKRGMFVTTFYAVLDYAKDTLTFCSAGHNPMIIYRAKTKKIELFNPTGIALGFDKGPLFQKTLKEGEAKLEKGDRFVLYTDGVVESMNEAKEEYTDERFHKFVIDHAKLDSKTFVQKLVLELRKHQGKAEQHDDITIVTFRKK